MSVTLRIPRVLSHQLGGQLEIELPANSMLELVDILQSDHETLFQSLFDETGQVRPHINFFKNTDLLNPRQNLIVDFQHGDVISVFQAVSGG